MLGQVAAASGVVVMMMMVVVVGSTEAWFSSSSLCDLPQCQCLISPRGADIFCKCLNDEDMTIRTSDLPTNVFNLTVEGCATVGMSDSLAPLPLHSLTFRGIKDLRIPSQTFLYGLRHLAAVVIEDTKIPVIPSFSFSALENIFSVVFQNVEIGSISSDAFSDLRHLRFLRFIKSRIGDIERNAFGRGKSKIANFIMEDSIIDTIHEGGVWLDDADIVQIDKCNVNKVGNNAIRLNNAFFFYLTRSSLGSYEPGGISGRYFSGVMIDNDYINPVAIDGEEPRPLFDLRESRRHGSAVAPFFHFTSNVLTKALPGHAFFITNPMINVAVPNNTVGECSCDDYRNFLRSLKPILDDYTLTVHQALVEHGICLLNYQIFSIGCRNLTPPLFAGIFPKNIRNPSRELALRITTKTAAETVRARTTTRKGQKTPQGTTAKPHLFQTVTHSPTTTSFRAPSTPRSGVTTTTAKPSFIPHLDRLTGPNASVFPPSILQSKTEKPLATVLHVQTLAESLSSLDAQAIWNEIYGGVFALRLRKPLPDMFPNSLPSMKFGKTVKPLELRRIHGGKPTVVSPR
ncbi:uncharacterized protein LOC121859903 [Homarus americanus]|uniref:uncharacterized protein LOC121859903 n=1 Tax=Homarus americanus TaxID=6706 RepID=UPI001C49469B|nr:uncharacterized protein LOC121859903 [Homarus americanus]